MSQRMNTNLPTYSTVKNYMFGHRYTIYVAIFASYLGLDYRLALLAVILTWDLATASQIWNFFVTTLNSCCSDGQQQRRR